MANPEVHLPQNALAEPDMNTNSDTIKDESEKHSNNDEGSNNPSDDAIGTEDSIVWHYLTFETELPSPAYLSLSPAILDGRPQPPECPNLDKYTSPFLWTKGHKSIIMWLSCIATMLTAYSAGAYAAGIDQMMREWHVGEVPATLGITTFVCGFAVAPMFLAPLSEISGRRPIFIVTGCLFVVFQLTCALTPTFAGMIVARFLVGCMSSTFSTMVGGVVSDIYHAENRNTAMALFSGSALFGTGLGPLCSGFIAQHTTWRWIFYVQVITCGILQAAVVLFFKETRGSVLLSRRAQTLNKWYEHLEVQGLYGVMMPPTKTSQRIRWKVKADEERGTIGQIISISLYRPFHLLFTEPVVFFFSLWISFAWAVLYLTFTAIPLVFETSHSFNLEQQNAVFAAIGVGAIISTVIAVYQESLARKWLPERHLSFLGTPEGRLYFSCVQSAFLPIGLFWFGWTSFSSTPWIVPTIALGCATMGIFSIYLAVFNYLADIYGRYASSALAAQSFCRNMLAGAFPLVAQQMFRKLTFQGAGSLLGGIATLLTLVPWALVIFGPRIRARSKFARGLVVNTS